MADLSGKDELLTGVLSKAKGQILRAAAALHVLFSIDLQHPRSEELSSVSIIAAINLIEVCNEHTALIGGRKGITAPTTGEFLRQHAKFHILSKYGMCNRTFDTN